MEKYKRLLERILIERDSYFILGDKVEFLLGVREKENESK